MREKTIHFHIGSGRCGSTLIQALFNEPAMHQVFAHFDLHYDPNIYLALNDVTPVFAYDDGAWRELRERLTAPLLARPEGNFFITQENIFGAEHGPGASNTVDNAVRAIRTLCAGFHVRIVAVVRRQDTFVESLYNQLLKRGETRDFPEFIADLPAGNFDWKAVLDGYAAAFGRDNVTVVPFEKKIVASGGIDDFIGGVLAAVGVTQKIRFDNVPTMNPSLSPRVRPLMRHANQILTPLEANNLAAWFEAHIPKRPDEPHGLLDDDTRAAFLVRYADANKAFAAEYLAAYPAAAAFYAGGA